jgi:hypothetical protein
MEKNLFSPIPFPAPSSHLAGIIMYPPSFMTGLCAKNR